MATITFNERLLQLNKVLRYFALSLTQDRDDADDLVQETMLKALTYRDKYTPGTNLKAWLHTIMKNTFINNYRRQTRARTIITTKDDLEVLDFIPAASSYSPLSGVGLKEVNKMIEELPDTFRIPFVMHNQGYKYKEVAEHLNIPIGTVKSRIFQAKQLLMRQLRDHRG
jgi:RNA polymerase sigma factor (sigma-70 family)